MSPAGIELLWVILLLVGLIMLGCMVGLLGLCLKLYSEFFKEVKARDRQR